MHAALCHHYDIVQNYRLATMSV